MPPLRSKRRIAGRRHRNTVRHRRGEGTRFTCPDCGGVLFERREGLLERFECSVGHVFSIESLVERTGRCARERAVGRGPRARGPRRPARCAWPSARRADDADPLGGRFERRGPRGARAGAHDPRRPSRAPRTTARSRLSRERAGRRQASEDGSETPLDVLLDVPQAHPRLRLHGLQARQLERRVAQADGRARASASYDEYLDYLEVHPDEFAALFNTILINVTGFFRDPRDVGLPRERRRPAAARGSGRRTTPIRVWCAGCASGEEAYTIAMVLAEALGERAFLRAREDLRDRRRRGGARHGAPRRLPAKDVEDVPRGRCSSATSSAPTSASRSARTCGAR